MKRVLITACMLLVAGFFMAGCEEEEHEHHHYYGYHDGYHHGYPRHGYYLSNESVQNDGVLQVETAVQP